MTRLTPIFQQFTGINAIMFYAPVLFGAGNDSLYSAVVFGAVNVLSTLVSLGRRILFPEAGVQMFRSQVARSFNMFSTEVCLITGFLLPFQLAITRDSIYTE